MLLPSKVVSLSKLFRNVTLIHQLRSNTSISAGSEDIVLLEGLLRTRFPMATAIQVQDISGGCGSLYEVWVETQDFKGLSRVKQHRLITETLAAQIKEMHGLRISTSIPKD